MVHEPLSSLGFFQQLHAHYQQLLTKWGHQSPLLEALLRLAWHSFDTNVQAQQTDTPTLDCHKGCATCCTLRVTATAPELLIVARFIRLIHPHLILRGINLPAQVAQANTRTTGLSETQRVSARQRCPFIAQGACVIYQVRPMACRGLASYDRRACAQAASGLVDGIPYSEPHMRIRSLVQNALQSALRDAGLAWGNYELIQGVAMALEDASLESRWMAGEDVFAHAQVHDVNLQEMAETFDALKVSLA